MTLKFTPLEQPLEPNLDAPVLGKGETFGEASFYLVQHLASQYGYEALCSAVFSALGELQDGDESKVEHRDFSCPEQQFDIEII